jgi:hypothetical protein
MKVFIVDLELLGFVGINSRRNAGQVVCSFVEISVVQIVLLLKDGARHCHRHVNCQVLPSFGDGL